jgi:hypothetical protein
MPIAYIERLSFYFYEGKYLEGKINMQEAKIGELIISGTIFPARWNERGEVVTLVIDTTNQDEYYIAQNKKGKELLSFIHHQVEIQGTLREGDNGNFVINVKNYKLINEKNEGSFDPSMCETEE